MTNRQLIDHENRQRLQVLETRTVAVRAMVVLDGQGRRWSRLPAAFREQAELCGAIGTYTWAGTTYIVRCRQRSLWASGKDGLCGLHFAGRLEMGE